MPQALPQRSRTVNRYRRRRPWVVTTCLLCWGWAMPGWGQEAAGLLLPTAGTPFPSGPAAGATCGQEPAPEKNHLEQEVDRLLEQLKQLQDEQESGSDPWARTIKELIELGPEATPILSRKLIETPKSDRRMLRSIPFVLRGIGDPRAVPALIQTLPKCNHNDGSDMGYNTEDKELLAFMRKHDDDLTDRDPSGYNWGRPINEVRTALNHLTGTSHGEVELCHIHGEQGTPRQKYLTEALFLRIAERWVVWWEENWRQFVHDEAYAKIELPDPSADGKQFELNRNVELMVQHRISNLICGSLFDKADHATFYDLDTGRVGTLPKNLRESLTPERESIISKWGVSEGYDLMGSEIQVDGKTVYVLRLLEGEAWELPFEVWEKYRPQSATELSRRGRAVTGGILAVQDGDDPEQLDYQGTGAFLVVTWHGTPVLLRLGVAVHDTDMARHVRMEDHELNPVWFHKGRRFGLIMLREAF